MILDHYLQEICYQQSGEIDSVLVILRDYLNAITHES